MKAWFGILFCAAILLLSPFARTTELADVIDSLRPSIVGIGTVRPVRGNQKPAINFRGTGFVVGKDRANKESLAIFVGRGKTGNAMIVRVLREDRDHDLALLEIIDGSLPAMRLGDAALIREGSDIALTGFPIGMVLGLYPVTHKGIISAITPIVIPAISSRTITAAQMKRMRNPFEVYQLDATAYPGNSGSPVYKRDTGEVIGVINSVFVKGSKETVLEKPSGISYAIPVRYVHDLLSSQ